MDSNNKKVADKLSSWLAENIKGIVSNPSDVQVVVSQDEMGLLFIVQVHESDIGVVIGKGGKHAQALRILLGCAGILNDVRAALKISAPGSQFNLSQDRESKEK